MSIAHSCERPLLRFAAPIVTPLVPEELHHWVPAALKTLLKVVPWFSLPCLYLLRLYLL